MYLNIRQSPEYGHFLEKINWSVDNEKDFRYYIRKIPLLGVFVKIMRPPTNPDISTINIIAQKHHAFSVAVDYSPIRTLQLDLSPSLEKILAQMDKDARYEIRKAETNNITVEKSTDIGSFINMWNQNAQKRGFWVPFGKEIRAAFEAFGENALLLMAKTEKRLVSGAVFFFNKDTASYFFAASTPEGRSLSSPSLIVWEAIKIAKKKGCKIFDFEGIQDQRDKNTKKWGGFTHFKKDFGGTEVEFPLATTIYYNPIIKLFSRFLG